MKNHKKILILFMFLFIYFVMPGDVLAVKESRYCVCTGNIDSVDSGQKQAAAEIHLEYDEWLSVPRPTYTVNVSTWASGAGLPGTFSRPLTNNSKFEIKPTQGGIACPKYVILNVKGNKVGDGYTGNGKVYMYTERGFTEDDRKWYSSTIESANKKCTGFCKYNEWALLTCGNETSSNDLLPNNVPHNNVDVNGDVQSTVEDRIDAAKNADAKEAYYSKKKQVDPKIVSKSQTCADVFGDTGTENSIAWILQKIFNYIRIFGILFTVVLGAFDYTKSLISNDFDSLSKSNKRLGFRILGIVALILLPVLINFLLGLFISGTITDFTCGIK